MEKLDRKEIDEVDSEAKYFACKNVVQVAVYVNVNGKPCILGLRTTHVVTFK